MTKQTDRSEMRDRNVMLFTVALNGYQWRYRSLIKTHASYAKKYGYHHVSVDKPTFSTLGLEVAWLKISLIIEALQAGYDWVVFLDADTRVSMATPDIEHICVSDKDIYACRGYSGRINSGVLIIKNTPTSHDFFKTVLRHAHSPIPAEDDVGWGENGHIIHFAKKFNCFTFLDSRWNNNYDPSLNDYIRHFSRGPMHSLFTPGLVDSFLSIVCHYSLAIIKRVKHKLYTDDATSLVNPKSTFHQELQNLTELVISANPTIIKP